jgi:hypothetical protein
MTVRTLREMLRHADQDAFVVTEYDGCWLDATEVFPLKITRTKHQIDVPPFQNTFILDTDGEGHAAVIIQ